MAVAGSKAQIVNIPDANFKAKLLATTGPIGFNSSYNIVPIDANHDGQIQVSEAQLIYRLWVMGSNISDLTGIESFTNLRELNCNSNNLTAINLASLPYLRELYCAQNSISNLNLTNLSLETLACNNNLLSNLDLHNLTALKYIYCNNNSLTNLNIAGLPQIFTLQCQHNQLTSLDFSSIVSYLLSVNCSYNNLSTIDLSVRASSNPIANQMNCSFNPNLYYINTKDGKIITTTGSSSKLAANATAIPGGPPPLPESSINFEGTPNLQNFCADANEMTFIQNKINTVGYTNPNCQLSSTCEFLNPTSNTTTATACNSYTWSVNGTTYTASGTYTVVTGDHTEILNLTINNSLITTAPTAPVLCTTLGSTANVSVTSNIATPTYTWEYRVVTSASPNPAWITITAVNAGTVYSNYTSGTLGIARTTTTLPKAGTQYRVTVSGECGSVTSDTVNLTIIGVVKAGTITAASSVCESNDITFILSNYVGTSIQWQSAANATSTFVNIPGATNATYTATNMQSGSDKSYRTVVTNAPCGTTATTAIKTITVSPNSVAGTATGGGLVCSGSSGTLKVMGYVGKIQWEYSTNGSSYFNAPTASAIPLGLSFGTTSTTSSAATYMVSNITGNLYFRAKITSGACSSIYTNVLQYTIAAAATVGTASATNTTICSGTATSVSLSSATGTITWQKSTNYTTATPTWTTIANSNTLSIATGNLTYNTAFRAMVSIGSCSTVYSNITYVYMIAKPLAKSIFKSVTSPSGATATTALCTDVDSKVLTIGAGYNGAIQWQTSTTSTTSGFSDIAGANGVSYTVTDPVAGANYFRTKFTNTCGVSVYGNAVTVFYQDCIQAKQTNDKLFEVTAYPNPYAWYFHLNLDTTNKEAIVVSIYDMTGRLIESNESKADDITALQLGVGFPPGLYHVVVTQGKEFKTLRLLKK